MRIEDAVVVITGATSGIGRATAMALAQRGAKLVLAARREHVLQEVAEECRREGGEVMVVPVDVADEPGIRSLAQRAIESFGRIDVWVNNAAVSAFGRLDEMPYHVFRRVIETNLFGYIHGARAVVPHFRQRGQGVLINVSSVAGEVGQPYTSAYCASKFAINGLSESLRAELMDQPDIHVCTILPPSVDTPLFQHAANYTGRAPQPMPPVHDPEEVAAAVLHAVEYPRREIPIGGAGRMISRFGRLTPGLAEKFMAGQVERKHFQDKPAENSEGNLFMPGELTGVHGGWKESSQGQEAQEASKSLVPATVAAIGLVALGAGAYGVRRWRNGHRREPVSAPPPVPSSGAGR